MVTILLVAMFKTAEILKIYTLNKHLRILGKVEAIVCTFMYSFLKKYYTYLNLLHSALCSLHSPLQPYLKQWPLPLLTISMPCFIFLHRTYTYQIGIYYLCIIQVFVYCLSPQLECKLHMNNDFVLFSTEYSVLSRAWHLISAQ